VIIMYWISTVQICLLEHVAATQPNFCPWGH
jgi:hypothetical protein